MYTYIFYALFVQPNGRPGSRSGSTESTPTTAFYEKKSLEQ